MTDVNKAIEIDPKAAWYYLQKAQMEVEYGYKKEALADCSKTIELDDSSFLAYVYRAGIYEELKQDKEALADYQKIVSLSPDYYYAYESIGLLSLAAADWPTCADAFKKAYAATPTNYDYGLLYAMALYRQGNDKGAKDFMATLIPVIDKEKQLTYYLLARVFAQASDTAELELQLQSEKNKETKATTLFFLAEYWITKKQPTIAEKYFLLVRDMKRTGTFADRVNEMELKRLGL
jgi:tetratricopeptide (TPR) repeat protein